MVRGHWQLGYNVGCWSCSADPQTACHVCIGTDEYTRLMWHEYGWLCCILGSGIDGFGRSRCCAHCTAHRDKFHGTAKVIQSQVRGLHWTVDYATTATRIFIVRSVLDVSMPWFVRVRVRTELSVGGLPSLPVAAVQTSSRPTGGSSSPPSSHQPQAPWQ